MSAHTEPAARRRGMIALSLAVTLLLPAVCLAQGNNGNNGNGNNQGGIRIDASGIVSMIAPAKESAAAIKKRQQSYLKEKLPEALAVPSELRRVSLLQLDQALTEASQAGRELPLEQAYLAGLTRIDYVVVDRETRDIAIVGPAEGFAPDAQGRMRGIKSGRPTLQLEDLIVAWRTVSEGKTLVTCSIDPTAEGLAAFNTFASQPQTVLPNQVSRLFDTMAEKLGTQTVRVTGVPPDSHWSLVLVEADLRMKRIALGKDPSLVRGVTSQLSMTRAGGSTLSRWWFVPLYDPLETNADHSIYRLSGQRLQLLAQDEFTNAQGDRSLAPTNRMATDKFAKQFTDHIPELAEAHPSFAELQNLFDLLVVCTLIRRHQLDLSIDWKPETLGNSESWKTATYPVPTSVESVAATNRVGRTVVGLIGGVELNAESVIAKTTEWKSDATVIPMAKPGQVWTDR